MSPITRATRPSISLPSPLPAPLDGPSSQGRTAVGAPSKPRMRKAPQRVGKSASAIFFTLSNPMIPFYFAGEGGWIVLPASATGSALSATAGVEMAYHEFAGAFMRDHLATLLDDFRRYDRQIAVVHHQGIRRRTTSYGEIARSEER